MHSIWVIFVGWEILPTFKSMLKSLLSFPSCVESDWNKPRFPFEKIRIKIANWELKNIFKCFFMFLHFSEDLELHFKLLDEHLGQCHAIEDQSDGYLSYRLGTTMVKCRNSLCYIDVSISAVSRPISVKFSGKITWPPSAHPVKFQLGPT